MQTIVRWKRLAKICHCRVFKKRRYEFISLRRFDHLNIAHLAQSVEHAAVNRRVVGSSPTVGAKMKRGTARCLFSFCVVIMRGIRTGRFCEAKAKASGGRFRSPRACRSGATSESTEKGGTVHAVSLFCIFPVSVFLYHGKRRFFVF